MILHLKGHDSNCVQGSTLKNHNLNQENVLNTFFYNTAKCA